MSRLYERMAVPCALMVRTRVPDGEGGWSESWAVGRRLDAAIAHDSSTESRVAEADGVANSYTVTCGEALSYGDVIRRLSDGQCFRVTSNADDGAPPACATFAFFQSTAEEWRLPDAD